MAVFFLEIIEHSSWNKKEVEEEDRRTKQVVSDSWEWIIDKTVFLFRRWWSAPQSDALITA